MPSPGKMGKGALEESSQARDTETVHGTWRTDAYRVALCSFRDQVLLWSPGLPGINDPTYQMLGS